jgi:glycosyltransferase involved in cell wall biosynthesis
VVVDDASTDGTRERIAQIARRDSRVVPVLLETNHGSGGVARNVGLERARGEYVKFLDHDDVLAVGTLPGELAAARDEDADLVMSGWGVCEIDAEGRTLPGSEKRYEPPALECLVDAILGHGKVPYTAAVLYRRRHLEGISWDPSVALIDDFDFFCRSALKPGRIARRTSLAYWWRRHPDSIRGRSERNQLAFLDAAYVWERIYRRVEDLLVARGELRADRRAVLAQLYYNGVRAFARFDPPKARKVLDHLFELDPRFQPTPRAEGNALVRRAASLIGVRPVVWLYAAVRRLADRLIPPSGWLSFRGEREVQ